MEEHPDGTANAERVAERMLQRTLDRASLCGMLDEQSRKLRMLLATHPQAPKFLDAESRELLEAMTDDARACVDLLIGDLDQWRLADVHIPSLFARADSPASQGDLELGLDKILHELAKEEGRKIGIDRNKDPATILAAISIARQRIGGEA